MPPIDWRQRNVQIRNTNYWHSVDYCLDGLYDTIGFDVYYRDITKDRKLLCWHDYYTVIVDLWEDRYSEICVKCRGIHHKHKFNPYLSESYQVELSPYESRIYRIEFCDLCEKRILLDGNIRVSSFACSDEIKDQARELIREYLPDVFLPIENRPYGSGYVLELPVWVAGQIANGKTNRARKMLYRIQQHHCIDDSLFSEIEGLRLNPYQRRLRQKDWKAWERSLLGQLPH